jgi:hypothetical protein
MTKIKRLLSVAIVCVLLISLFPASNVFAAPSCSMSISGNTEVGSIITVSVKLNSDGLIGGYNGSFSYEAEYFELQSISIGNYTSGNFSSDSLNFTDYGFSISSGTTVLKAKFKCMKVGTKSISCYFDDVGDDVGTSLGSTSCGASITIVTPVPKSSNSNLSKLTVSPGTLSPAFSKTTKSYSMSVGEDQTKITVSATAEDSKATVSLNGVQKSLQPGDNTVKITVKAEDGTTKVYSIVVTRQSGPTGTPTPTPEPLPLMTYLEEELMILPIDELTVIPEGFAADFSTYKGVQIPVVKGKASPTSTEDLLLVLLVTDTGAKYFVYDPALQTVYPFLFVSQTALSLQVLQASETLAIPVGYEAFPFVYEGETITAYRLISNPELKQILLYVKNAEGAGVFYYYDTQAIMLMPYLGEVLIAATPTPTIVPTETDPSSNPSDTSALPTESNNSESKTLGQSLTDLKNPLTIVFYLVSLIALVLIAAVVTLLLTRNSGYSDDIEEEIDDDENLLPEDEQMPPPLVAPDRKDYFYSFGESEETQSHNSATRPGPVASAPNYPPIAVNQVAKPPVASETPVMGVRTINLNNIPGLASSVAPVIPAAIVDTPAVSPVPVRLKQELEAEKLSAASQMKPSQGSVASPIVPPQKPSSNANKPGPYDQVLDFPDLSKDTGKKPQNNNPSTDPDME